MGNSVLDWEYLPENCLCRILEEIDEPVSLVQFGAVCRHWHSMFNIFLDIKRRSSTNMVPMLLIPSKKNNAKGKLYSLQAKSKVSEIEFPKPYTWRFCGSCYGWLARADEKLIITLSNPFKNVNSIQLPPLESPDSGPDHLKIRKVVLSNDPLLHPNNYVVIVIHSSYGRLALYKPGRKDWIYIDKDEFRFGDIIFHKNLVYAIGHYSNLVSFEVDCVEDDESSKSPKLNTLGPEDWRWENYSHQTYLVKSSMRNLYSIHRYLRFNHLGEDNLDIRKKFRVFRLILNHENGELLEKKEVESIDGDIVFVGFNETLAVSALEFPEGQPDSIYFTDDYTRMVHEACDSREIGIFHLKDGSFGKYYQFKDSHKHLPPYIWTLPPPF